MKPSDLPNIISIIRLIAVVPVVYLLIQQQYLWALILFAVAGASDGLDGFLAKHYGWQSRLGGILDPLADKTLLVCCFLVLGAQDLIPLWLVLAVVLRDLVIVSGAVLYNYGVAEVDAAPIPVSKANTAIQILLVVAVLTDAGFYALPDAALSALVWGCLITVLISGAQYVWVWGRKAARQGWKSRG
ncbi:CDP-alcohol phosphatidyltransferase family protein [Thiorhodococcus mannitoliphagus]|uniref:CDP-diacylglycerol--glycerol-3-phosphate 3-phosphatidyltransferase n=1 Tax=Thiorhodococcus mannitoliphagus TaxID=329406 RepID=A0A6P1E1Y6_9GAMM|nr:CDP-alcohol phosphatidyltransferase family protein [Thiorhodococcus mannitoliphagus]NEX22522.1 CDP-alcohol phosphatidyltransferase family protein [Thiorhodococcus mannitoliphagus]